MKSNNNITIGAVVVAAGTSRRMGEADKILATINERPVLAYSLDTFQKCESVDRIVVVVNAGNLAQVRRLSVKEGWSKVTDLCIGGKRRQDSVRAGLERLEDCDYVIIHDGARPLVSTEIIEQGLKVALDTGAAVAAVPVKDTIKVVDAERFVQYTPVRDTIWAVQTPQIFSSDIIKEAYRLAKGDVTDDASLVEQAGHKVKLFMGSYDNIKITTPDDLSLAEILLKKRGTMK